MLNSKSGLLGLSGSPATCANCWKRRRRTATAARPWPSTCSCASAAAACGAYWRRWAEPTPWSSPAAYGRELSRLRNASCAGLEPLGVVLDDARQRRAQRGQTGEISKSGNGSRVKIQVIPTNEELLIARDAFRAVSGLPSRNPPAQVAQD